MCIPILLASLRASPVAAVTAAAASERRQLTQMRWAQPAHKPLPRVGLAASPCDMDLDAPDASGPQTSSDHPPVPGAAPSPSTAGQPCHWADHGKAGQLEAEEDLYDVAEAARGGPDQCKELLAAFAGPDPPAVSGEVEAPLEEEEEEEEEEEAKEVEEEKRRMRAELTVRKRLA